MQLPDADELRRLAEELMGRETTMTISTAREDAPWAAPVYYVHRKSSFYFFSDPSSRHIQEAMESGKASAAIFHQASHTWKEIRGIQMSGSIVHLGAGLEAIRATRAYLQKFPFTRDFFDSAQVDLDAFVRKFKVRLYAFRPTVMLYQDNRIRFSFREEVPLD
jgi:uncharacterized protein YhbP (UPF0306 family)